MGIEKIYLAGGCFWGLEEYFKRVKGVVDTDVGYANGKGIPLYEEVCRGNTHFKETVEVFYDSDVISLVDLLELYYMAIDPFSIDKQKNDVGEQYRTGIYYINENQKDIAEKFIENKQKDESKKIQIEVKKLDNYFKAEDYHQDYLEINSNGYCHIDFSILNKTNFAKYKKPDKKELYSTLTKDEFKIMLESATEKPFTSELLDEKRKGIYVDKVTKEPLFSSCDKFDSGCGWPSFSKPIKNNSVKYFEDYSYSMNRVEVRSNVGNYHLGHVFEDGPEDTGGLRYCINGLSLEFIPLKDMKKLGYEDYIKYVK